MEIFLAGKSRRLYKASIYFVSLIPRRCGVRQLYASLLGISGASQLNAFEKPVKNNCLRALHLNVFEQPGAGRVY
jgi:hypothetical protein